jgi:hypothetical protein
MKHSSILKMKAVGFSEHDLNRAKSQTPIPFGFIFGGDVN